MHEVFGHGDFGAVGQDELGVILEAFDNAEDVVPASAIESGHVFAKFVDDFVHLKGRKYRFDEDGGLDGALWHAEEVLRFDEDVVPQTRLEVVFHLRQVEVRACAAPFEFFVIVKKVEREVEDAARDGLAVQGDVLLVEVPPARPHKEHGRLGVQAILFAFGIRKFYRPADGVAQVDLTFDQAVPGRRVRVLEIGHEHLCAGVQRVDDHLTLDGTGNLDAAVQKILGQRRAFPVAVAKLLGLGKEVGEGPGVKFGLGFTAAVEDLGSSIAKLADESGEKAKCLRRQDFGVLIRHRGVYLKSFDLYGRGVGHSAVSFVCFMPC